MAVSKESLTIQITSKIMIFRTWTDLDMSILNYHFTKVCRIKLNFDPPVDDPWFNSIVKIIQTKSYMSGPHQQLFEVGRIILDDAIQ